MQGGWPVATVSASAPQLPESGGMLWAGGTGVSTGLKAWAGDSALPRLQLDQ